jgi:hypothetical protein
MKKEDITHRMPTLPSPDQPPGMVARQLIDAIKNMWNQLKDIRTEAKSYQDRIASLERKVSQL